MRIRPFLLKCFIKLLPKELIFNISKFLNKKFILLNTYIRVKVKQRKQKYLTRHYYYK